VAIEIKALVRDSTWAISGYRGATRDDVAKPVTGFCDEQFMSRLQYVWRPSLYAVLVLMAAFSPLLVQPWSWFKDISQVYRKIQNAC